MQVIKQAAPLLTTDGVSFEQWKELAERGELFAIIDSCNAPLVPPKMQELGDDRVLSLFKGMVQQHEWATAPYFTRVDGSILRWLREILWKTPWGVFVHATESFIELHLHLRKLLIVELPDRKDWFFRYYDPRVLQLFLSTCNREDLEIFFGPVRAYGSWNSETSKMWTIQNLAV